MAGRSINGDGPEAIVAAHPLVPSRAPRPEGAAIHFVRVIVLSVGLSVAALPALAAPNDIMPGLWEWTADYETTGGPIFAPETSDQAQPSPEVTKKHSVFRRCMTQSAIDVLAKLQPATDEESQGPCTMTVDLSTATVVQVHAQCTEPKMSRTYRFEALSRESFIFHKDVATSPRPNKTLDVKTDVHAKWLGADCGDVKP